MRLFVGIKSPPESHAAIAAAAETLRDNLGVRMLPPENWHLTLKFIGDAEDAASVKRIEDALSSVRFSPFDILLSGAGAFPNKHFPRAIWVGGKSKECEELAAKVEEALSFLRLKKEKFSVHLTVARAPKGVADIEDFLQKTGEVCSFRVDSLLLVKSTLLPQGPVYEVLKEYDAQE